MNPLRRFCLAASYITSIPFLPKPESETELFGLAKYLPAVGTLVGSILALLALVCNELLLAPPLVAAALLTFWIVITGAIHLDGLMDTADGVFSHRSRERMLEIMKDPRAGNFGVVSGVLIILLKFAALLSLNWHWIFASLLLIPGWARWSEVIAIKYFPYAREEGMGKIWHISTGKFDLLISAIAPLMVSLFFCYDSNSFIYLWLIPLTVLPGLLASMWINKVLGGQTGDSYGANVEVSEAAGLIGASLLYANLHAICN